MILRSRKYPSAIISLDGEVIVVYYSQGDKRNHGECTIEAVSEHSDLYEPCGRCGHSKLDHTILSGCANSYGGFECDCTGFIKSQNSDLEIGIAAASVRPVHGLSIMTYQGSKFAVRVNMRAEFKKPSMASDKEQINIFDCFRTKH